jgi:chromosome segregation ATPase
MAKKPSKKALEVASQIESLGKRYLQRHRKLSSMLRRRYVRSYELYEEPVQDVERTISLVVQRLRSGVGLPKGRKNILQRLKKLTRKSVALIREEIVMQQRDDYIEALRNLGEDENTINELIKEIDKIGWNRFFKSDLFVPLGNFGSPRLLRYIQQYGESPLTTRLRQFVDRVQGRKDYRNIVEDEGLEG